MQPVAGTIARAVSDLAAWGAGVVAGEETRTAWRLIVVDQCDQVIRENPASRGTETSAEVLVGPPLGAGGWSETPVNSSGTR